MNFLLNRKVTISMLFISLTLLGVVSYKQLAVELMPNAELPAMTISVSAPQDMDPAYIDAEVIIPLEGAIRSIGGVDQIETQINSNRSTIQIEFKSNVNIKTTTLKIEEKMKEMTSSIPEGFNIRVQRGNDMTSIRSANFMSLQVRGLGGVDRVRNVVDEQIRSELENIDGIAAVNIFGGREKAIEIRIDKDACKALNLTTSSISRMLSNQAQDKVFVGNVKEPDNQYFVHVNSTFSRISDLENVVVAPGPILLKDVATIFFDYKEETSYSRVNGRESVTVSLASDAQSNMIDLSKRTKSVVNKLNEQLTGLDVEVVIDSNQADEMESNINDILWLALIGGLLAILVIWFFLKNIRLVFFIALAIPISIFTAFNFFFAAGITINMLTLIGMTLAVGMLLHNSIVVLENIYRLSGTGLSPERAVIQGTTEVWRSIVASTLTTITVFLPFIFTEDSTIRLIGNNIGVSIVSTLLISMAVGLLFIPMVAYGILKSKYNKSVFYEKMTLYQRPVQIYLVILKSCLRNPGVTIFGAVILLFAVLLFAFSTNLDTRREIDVDRFNVNLTTRTGSTLDNTDKVVRMLEERIAETEIPELQDVISRVNPEEATLTLVLKKDYKNLSNRGMSEIQADVQTILPRIEGVQMTISNAMGSSRSNSSGGGMRGTESMMNMMGAGSNQERILVRGSDYDLMQRVGSDLQYMLETQDYIRSSRVSFPQRQAEIRLTFDQILLSSYNISRNNISAGLSEMNTELSSNVTFKVGEEFYDIMIRNKEPELTEDEEQQQQNRQPTVDQLQKVLVANASGGLHNLPDIATINKSYGRSRITKVNQDKQLNVQYSFTRDIEQSKPLLEGYRADIDEMITNYPLPEGVAIQVIHQEDVLGDFKFLIIAAIILIFIILACVFESVSTPFVMLLTIPLAAIGSLVALIMSGNTNLFGTNSLIGFLILIGVVTNNGILLIDYTNILRTRGFRRERALMTAGLARIRPIVITSVTNIIALFPLAMGDTNYSGQIGAPFAITVIGGLVFSTLLTLVVIPTAAMAMENALAWYRALSLKTKLFHLALLLIGICSVYLYVDDTLWQVIYLIALIIIIPGVTWFSKTTLRHAKSDVVDKNKEIHIVVSNLVKIYDRPGRFSRQWNSGLELNERLGIRTKYQKFKDFVGISWQVGLWAFAIYFTYFYLESKTWIFLMSFALYAATLYIWNMFRSFLFHHFPSSKIVRYFNRLIFWSVPLVILYLLYKRLENPAMVGVIALLWVICIIIYLTSKYLYNNEINIERLSGRFVGLRRFFFRFVKSVPIIGKRNRPFKALHSISFEIKTGMFGLLGPNGAGKSTFMRIITGILEQSYGSIWINGLDTIEYREELQSLIGFLPQEFGTYENMSAWEFLDYQGILKGLTNQVKREERIEYVLKSVHLIDRKNDKIGSFSGGMKQRIGIALILLHLPRILVVDEPTAGLDPRERIRFRNLLVELSKDRIVIFSTHIIEDISSSCNQVVVVNKGELKYFGDPIAMVEMAVGKVWRFYITQEEFEEKMDKSLVVHNIQDGDLIQVRYLSTAQPYPDAVQVEANLEDAYLCLLKNM